MASNDPTDTGGLFVGRRPGTRPVRFPVNAKPSEGSRRGAEKAIAAGLLVIETILCVSVWGPQQLFWLWFGSHAQYWTGSVEVGISSAFVGMQSDAPALDSTVSPNTLITFVFKPFVNDVDERDVTGRLDSRPDRRP